jgi:hypothetical protein
MDKKVSSSITATKAVKKGCMDKSALNYDPLATVQGECRHGKMGCIDPLASNFDPTATTDNGSCVFE